MFFDLLIWYGIYQIFVIFIRSKLEGVVEDPIAVELAISFALAYFIYISLVVFEFLLNRYPIICCLKIFYIQEIVYLISFMAVIILWHALWDSYDLLVFSSDDYKILIFFITHFVGFFISFIFQIGSSLYGPRGIKITFDAYNKVNKNLHTKDFLSLYSHIRFFDITYLSAHTPIEVAPAKPTTNLNPDQNQLEEAKNAIRF